MGWSFTRGASKKDIIKEQTANQENEKGKWTCLAHCVKGTVLWSVWEHLDKEKNEIKRYIACDLLALDKDCGWGYKDMDESMGPYYYSCPLSYLDMVPEVTNQEWRDEVRKHHEKEQKAQSTKKNLKVGDRLGLVRTKIPYVVITEVGKKIMGTYNGIEYHIPRRFIGEIIPKEEYITS